MILQNPFPSGSSGIVLKLLWENANPKGGKFNAKTISLDLSEYQMIYMEYLYTIYGDTILSGLFTKNTFYLQALGGRSAIRAITINDDGIVFDTAYFWEFVSAGSGKGDDNAYNVPVRIYGVKNIEIT